MAPAPSLVALFLATLFLAGVARAAEPAWKTAYVKRGYVGNFELGGLGAPAATVRNRTPMPFDGTRVRLSGVGSLEKDVALAGLWLVPGTDDQGGVANGGAEVRRHPITFAGQPGVLVPKGLKPVKSDEVDVPIKRGTWYVEDRYDSPAFPYAYEVDTLTWRRDPDTAKPAAPTTGQAKHVRSGLIRRIDVLTTDARPLVACYGDSITHGYGSTPDAAARYPDVLSKLADRPVLNLGVNGDTFAQNAHCANAIGELAGVEQVVFLMGINDIVMRQGVKSADEYAKVAAGVIAGLRQRKIKVVWGTIPPAGGLKQMDDDPAKEALRVAINAWVRSSPQPDAVVDKALADPAAPGRMRDDLQGERIHPNDKGYAVMGEAAAEALKRLK